VPNKIFYVVGKACYFENICATTVLSVNYDSSVKPFIRDAKNRSEFSRKKGRKLIGLGLVNIVMKDSMYIYLYPILLINSTIIYFFNSSIAISIVNIRLKKQKANTSVHMHTFVREKKYSFFLTAFCHCSLYI